MVIVVSVNLIIVINNVTVVSYNIIIIILFLRQVALKLSFSFDHSIGLFMTLLWLSVWNCEVWEGDLQKKKSEKKSKCK